MGNREIKFRAWYKGVTSEFIPVDSIDFKKKLITCGVSWRWIDEITLEQFTGLYDKDGKEIYEGDIVVWYVNESIAKGIVEYLPESGCYDLKNFSDNWHVCNDWLRGEYEVLGNIHENKELLTKEEQ